MKALNESKIIERFGYSTFDKGKEYYNENRVLSAFINGDLLEGVVVGTNVYRTSVLLSDLSNKCSCPLGGDCKHVVALLLFYLKNSDEVIDIPKLKDKLREKSKEELIDIIIKALGGEEILPLIEQKEKNIKIRSILRIFERGEVDERTVENISNIIRNFKNNISKEDLLMLLEKITLDCENFGCFYDDYGDYYYNESIFKAIGEALVEKDLTSEDIEKLKEILDRDQYELSEPLIDVLANKAEGDEKFFKLIQKILPPTYRADIVIKNKMYDEAKKMLEKETLDPSLRVELLKLIDPREAIRVAEENKEYTLIIQYYIEMKDYDKAKAYINKAIEENLRTEVFYILSKYKNFILQDRELSNKIVRYLLDIGDILSPLKFYGNIDDDLKDLYAEKILESGYEFYIAAFLDVICQRKPEKVKEFLLKSVETMIDRGSREYDYVALMLTNAKKCMSKKDFNELLDEIEIKHYKKRKLIEKLSVLRD
ncbi:SWIM zinc finger family protein [Saccharolobus shibatae]|nr:SWIM zinc finger family protein [Saccharolobus shibatae]